MVLLQNVLIFFDIVHAKMGGYRCAKVEDMVILRDLFTLLPNFIHFCASFRRRCRWKRLKSETIRTGGNRQSSSVESKVCQWIESNLYFIVVWGTQHGLGAIFLAPVHLRLFLRPETHSFNCHRLRGSGAPADRAPLRTTTLLLLVSRSWQKLAYYVTNNCHVASVTTRLP